MKCSQCGSGKISKRGIRRGKQRQRCNDCGNWDSFKLFDNKGRIKVLLFDIETTPMECFVWQLNSKSNNYISHGNIIEDWKYYHGQLNGCMIQRLFPIFRHPKKLKKEMTKEYVDQYGDYLMKQILLLLTMGIDLILKSSIRGSS